MQQPVPPAPQAAKPKPPPPAPPPEFEERAIATMDGPALVGLLTGGSATEFQKAKACQRVGELGAKEAVPALAALLNDEHLAVYARYGLEPIADDSAGDALRAALGKLKGDRQIGVVNSLGKRRDAKAAPALARMLSGQDADLARAAAAALGNIGTAAAAKDLQAALPKAAGLTKTAVADALLVCADRMIEAGDRDQALALYAALSGPNTPKPARLGAMSSIVREETSTRRPR